MSISNPFSDPGYRDDEDTALVKRALGGERSAVDALVRRHQPFIYNVALKMTNNVADSEDITQEVLVKLLTNMATYDPAKARLRTWLYRITFNHILDLKKQKYEELVPDFETFFGYIDAVEAEALNEEEERELKLAVEEGKVACMAGMLMCLDRPQRLIYIVGDVFEIDHNVASEIFNVSPDNFRQKLSRARKDLHSWMHKRCGLVNTANPCRCAKKTKGFVALGYVDPKGGKWHADRISSIHELSRARLDDALDARDAIYVNLFREHPFKKSVKAERVLEEILGNRDFRQVMDLG